MRFFTPKEIKWDVCQWIQQNQDRLRHATIVDVPAGTGYSTTYLKNAGANVRALDLFPEHFSSEGVTCERADLSQKLPLEARSVDFVLCQEGIEHVPDHEHVLKEFSRILKDGGTLLLTTPNYSNLKGKISYLLGECEILGRSLPPNEIDSIWGRDATQNHVYYGHVFLTGFHRLCLLARLQGLELKALHPTRAPNTGLFLFPFFYPWILYYSWRGYRRSRTRAKTPQEQMLLKRVFRWAIHPRVLLQRHLFLEFQKPVLST